MRVSYKEYALKFRYPFTISRGTKTHQPTLVVELDHLGIKGYGEAPAITYYHIPIEKMIADLEEKRGLVERFVYTEPERYWHYLHHLFPQNSFLVCALDIASWDLFGKWKKKRLHEFWTRDFSRKPLTDYTIGIDSVEKMVSKLKEKPWPIYKVKLGTREDIAIIESLRGETDAAIRVDANAAWKVEEALEIIPRLKELGVEFIEQPLAKDDWEGMKILFEKSSLPLIADEACVSEKDVDACQGYFHGINIKLTKCSGITPALRMIRRARELKMSVMIGSMNESSIGSAAIAHLAPLTDYIDNDGPLLLEEDIATGLQFENGEMICSDQPGLGIRITDLYQKPL